MKPVLSVPDSLVAAVFAMWFLCTLLRQIAPSASACLKKRDLFQIVPAWKFFAGSPGPEFELFYRDTPPEGSPGEWTKGVPAYRSGYFSFLWNPGRRLHKSLTKDIHSVLSLSRKAPASREFLAASRALRGYVRDLPGTPGVMRRCAVFVPAGFDRSISRLLWCSGAYSPDSESE